jgi:hypothetical protein
MDLPQPSDWLATRVQQFYHEMDDLEAVRKTQAKDRQTNTDTSDNAGS